MKHWFGALSFCLIACFGLLFEVGLDRAAEAKGGKELQIPKGGLRLPSKVSTAATAKAPQVNQNSLLIMPAESRSNQAAEKNSNFSRTRQNNLQPSGKNSAKSLRLTAVKSSLNTSRSLASQSDVVSEEEDAEEDLASAVRQMGGDIVETIGEGPRTVWVVKFSSTERFIQAERRLVNDTRVKSLQRDYLYRTNELDATAVNDPFFASQWYLEALNVLPAWKLSKGGTNVLGIIDSGTDIEISDLKQKSLQGFDAITGKFFQSDVYGHGTMVATTAAATANNGSGTAGPATLSRIYPVRVGYATGLVSVSAILKAIEQCGNTGIKIINISSNAPPPYTFSRRQFNRVLHDYLEWYHDVRGGLVFNSAGNSGTRDECQLRPYLIVVSAIDESYSLANFSTFGHNLWFTGPGTNIFCSDRGGKTVSVAGTSFSSPLCASIAALIWGAKPSMSNLDVERILIETCQKARGRTWTQWFGYGMPDAEAAMRKTLGK